MRKRNRYLNILCSCSFPLLYISIHFSNFCGVWVKYVALALPSFPARLARAYNLREIIANNLSRDWRGKKKEE